MEKIKEYLKVYTLVPLLVLLGAAVMAVVASPVNWLDAAFALIAGVLVLLGRAADVQEKKQLENQVADAQDALMNAKAAQKSLEDRMLTLQKKNDELVQEVAKLSAALQEQKPVEVTAAAALKQEAPKKKRTKSKKTVSEIKQDLKAVQDKETK